MPAEIRGLAWALAVAGGLLLGAGEAAAQSLSLDAVDSLAARGEAGAARSLLEEWWEERASGAGRDELQRALWLRGKLSLDAGEAGRAYRRLVVEYPTGSYTDDALLRLGLAALARDESAAAAGYFRRLVRDHPWSPLREDARRRLRRLEAGGGASPQEERPGGRASPERTGEEAGGAAGPHAVQLGAFSEEARARRVLRRARDAGLEARLIRVAGSELIRVRVGRYPSRRAAEEVAREVRRKGLEAAVVSDANREEPIR